MIYLACPYSHRDPAVREARFHAANRLAARLMEGGHVVFSPLSMSHPIEGHMSEIHDTDWWMRIGLAFMENCASCVVVAVDGWETSKGVAIEIAWFKARGLPVSFMSALPQ